MATYKLIASVKEQLTDEQSSGFTLLPFSCCRRPRLRSTQMLLERVSAKERVGCAREIRTAFATDDSRVLRPTGGPPFITIAKAARGLRDLGRPQQAGYGFHPLYSPRRTTLSSVTLYGATLCATASCVEGVGVITAGRSKRRVRPA